jgi:O-antigen ligase
MEDEVVRNSKTFWICAFYTFLMISRTVEFIDSSGRLHLALLSGLICIVALISAGTIPKMVIAQQGKWLNLFCFWMFIGLPFSTWRGGSVAAFQQGWLKSYLTFFIVGGLIMTLKQFRTMAMVLTISTISQIYLAFKTGGNQEDDRLAVVYGSLGNANDLAAALLMGAPFILFMMADKRVNIILRMTGVPLLIALVIAVLKTGSRGGLVAMGVLIVFAFVKANAGGKLKIMVAGVAVLAVFAVVVPQDLRNRYMTIFRTDRAAVTSAGDQSALDSSETRRELLKNAAILTIRHPIFGIGLGQFSPQSFNLFVSRGKTGMWFTCHDIFGLVSAETGIPGLFFYCMVLISTFRSLSKLAKLPHRTPELELISKLGEALMVATVAYVTCGIFSTAAYSHQLPMLAALAAALDRVSAPYLSGVSAFQIPTGPQPFVNRRLAQRTVPVTS